MSTIAKAFVQAKKEFAPALKTSSNPHFRSKYADLSGCLEAVNDALLNAGIAVYQETSESDTGVVVETVFLHESGEVLRGGKLHVPAAKHDPQGYGSALTYARRYSLMAACGMAPEDDDGNASSKRPQQAPPQQDMSPKARADRMRVGVSAGDAVGVAETLSLLPQAEIEAIMGFWPQDVYDKVVAAWPEVK
jgi:hypothetical protein